MPLYDYKCDSCGNVFERFGRISESHCECECGATARRQISTRFSVHGDIDPHWDRNMGHEPVWVKSKQHRKRLLKERGLSEVIGKGWK